MSDLIESAVGNLTNQFLNHSDEIFATQVVSIAIQLSQSNVPNEIYPKIDIVFELIENTKKKISTKKLEARKHR